MLNVLISLLGFLSIIVIWFCCALLLWQFYRLLYRPFLFLTAGMFLFSSLMLAHVAMLLGPKTLATSTISTFHRITIFLAYLGSGGVYMAFLLSQTKENVEFRDFSEISFIFFLFGITAMFNYINTTYKVVDEIWIPIYAPLGLLLITFSYSLFLISLYRIIRPKTTYTKKNANMKIFEFTIVNSFPFFLLLALVVFVVSRLMQQPVLQFLWVPIVSFSFSLLLFAIYRNPYLLMYIGVQIDAIFVIYKPNGTIVYHKQMIDADIDYFGTLLNIIDASFSKTLQISQPLKKIVYEDKLISVYEITKDYTLVVISNSSPIGLNEWLYTIAFNWKREFHSLSPLEAVNTETYKRFDRYVEKIIPYL